MLFGHESFSERKDIESALDVWAITNEEELQKCMDAYFNSDKGVLENVRVLTTLAIEDTIDLFAMGITCIKHVDILDGANPDLFSFLSVVNAASTENCAVAYGNYVMEHEDALATKIAKVIYACALNSEHPSRVKSILSIKAVEGLKARLTSASNSHEEETKPVEVVEETKPVEVVEEMKPVEVVKEVPVEKEVIKEVIKEVPVEKIVYKESSEKVEVLTMKIESMQTLLDATQALLDTQTELNNALTEKLAEADKQNDSKYINTALMESAKVIQEDKEKAEQRAAELEEQLNDTSERLAKLQEEYEQVTASNEDNSTVRKSLEEQVAQDEAELTSIQESLMSMSKELGTQISNGKKLELELEEIQKEHSELQHTFDETSTELSQTAEKLEQTTNQLNEAEENLVVAHKQVEELSDKAATAERERDSAQDSIIRMQAEMSILEVDKRDLQREKEELKAKYREFDALERELQKLKDKLAEKEAEELERKQQEENEANLEDIDSISKDFENSQMVTDLKDEIAQKESELSDIKDAMAESESKITELTSKIDELTNTVDGLTNDNSELSDELDKSKQKGQKLQEDLNNAENRNSFLQQQVEITEKKAERLQESLRVTTEAKDSNDKTNNEAILKLKEAILKMDTAVKASQATDDKKIIHELNEQLQDMESALLEKEIEYSKLQVKLSNGVVTEVEDDTPTSTATAIGGRTTAASAFPIVTNTSILNAQVIVQIKELGHCSGLVDILAYILLRIRKDLRNYNIVPLVLIADPLSNSIRKQYYQNYGLVVNDPIPETVNSATGLIAVTDTISYTKLVQTYKLNSQQVIIIVDRYGLDSSFVKRNDCINYDFISDCNYKSFIDPGHGVISTVELDRDDYEYVKLPQQFYASEFKARLASLNTSQALLPFIQEIESQVKIR